MGKGTAEYAGPGSSGLGLGRVTRIQDGGCVASNSSLWFERCRHEKQYSTTKTCRHDDMVGVKSVRSSIRPVQYARHGHVGRAKSNSHTRPVREASNIVSFPHAPEPTGRVHTGPAPCLSPLRWRFSHRADNGHAKPCGVICEGVSGLCTSPHFHFFFRHRCPLFWLLYPGPRPSLASAAVILISLRQVPRLLSRAAAF